MIEHIDGQLTHQPSIATVIACGRRAAVQRYSHARLTLSIASWAQAVNRLTTRRRGGIAIGSDVECFGRRGGMLRQHDRRSWRLRHDARGNETDEP